MDNYIEIIKKYCVQNNIDVYMVGGAVRNKLMDRPVKDVDIVVSGDCHNMAKYAAKEFNGSYVRMHSDVGRVVAGEKVFDFCNFKGNDIYEDLKKRDFTINSIAVDLRNEKIIDINGGIEDINNKTIRAVYDEAFDDDPVRMLRAVRLACEYGFKIHSTTKNLIKKKSKLLVKSAPERIMEEVLKIFKYPATHSYVALLDRLYLLGIIFPVMDKMKGIGKCRYHRVDAYTHSYLTLEFVEDNIENIYRTKHGKKIEEHFKEPLGAYSRYTIMKLGALLHDIGKPSAMRMEGNRVSFRGHDKTGETEFLRIALKYNMSNIHRRLIRDIILGHMKVLVMFKEGLTDRMAYRFFREFGKNSVDILIVSLFDVIATTSLLFDNTQSGEYWDFVMEMLDKYYTSRDKNLKPLTGREVMSITGARGKCVGKILNIIEEEVYIGNIKNKSDAIEYIRKYFIQKHA